MEETRPIDNRSEERIVISGMSGLYPESHSVKELSDILYNKINPVNDKNAPWSFDHPEIIQYMGKIPGLMLFDDQFFAVHRLIGKYMDPMYRKLLEHSYQAIFDAGINTEEFHCKKVGVFIGSCLSETEKACFYNENSKIGYGLIGCNRSMSANRISYWLKTNGPSLAIDESCCSSIGALKQAYHAIKNGECEAAIVGGANLCLHPQSSTHFGRIIKLSADGKTKSFDNEAAGCARSEAINVLLLQKAKDALRIYAEVIHVKSEYTSTKQNEERPRYDFYRDPETLTNFISNFYEEAKVPPELVEYVEAFGSAVPEIDKIELEAIGKVFCENRNKELLVGSVMSNIGYGGGASGLSAVTKVLLGYHHGQLAGNLHCESPRKDIEVLCDGRMRIVTDHQTFGRHYTAVNGLSITGINSHVLLHGNYKPKDLLRYKTKLPYLVTISGRQESSVKKILDDLKSRPTDAEEIALLHNIHKTSTSSHLGRGYIILDTDENNQTITLDEKTQFFDDARRPLWFVYSGMGSQWAGMGVHLMRIPVFAAAIERCHRALEPKGVDIVQIITSRDSTVFDNILHSFIGIAAIQIGLTDVLRALDILPDKIIGHSVGELGCAYADGCFTTEEMILSAYARGLVSVQTPFIYGSMAAVGLGYQQISKMCPSEIDVACHNGPDSSTISGPADIMNKFIVELTANNIFVKGVSCSNIAYHSRYISDAGPRLLQYLSEIIKTPAKRSERWVSTSIPQDKWNDPLTKYSSAEYYTNNLLKPVLFEEACCHIPNNAVLVEIAPDGILQSILKRSLPDTCKPIPLTRRGHPDNALFLLNAIGNLFMVGYNPKLQTLYPNIEFPVSTGTPMLSHLVEWEHGHKWGLSLHVAANRKTAATCTHVISIHDDEHRYLNGHVIREKNTYPFAAVLVTVWDTFAIILGVPKKTVSVQFSDVYLYSQPMLDAQRHLRLSVAILRGTGRFEVMDEDISIATGFITVAVDDEDICHKKINFNEEMELKSDDIYEMFTSRNYNYSGEFQNICDANLSLTKAHLLWQNNWVTLIDGIIQINALRRTHTYVSQPTSIRNLKINVEAHMPNKTSDAKNTICLPVEVSEIIGGVRIRCGGISIEDIKFRDLVPITRKEIVLKTLKFIPHNCTNSIDEITALSVFLQIIAENLGKQQLKIVQVIEKINRNSYDLMQQFVSDMPEIKFSWSHISQSDVTIENSNSFKDVDVLVTNNLKANKIMCQLLHEVFTPDTFLINKELYSNLSKIDFSVQYRSVCTHTIGFSCLELIVWQPSKSTTATSTVNIFSQADINSLSTKLTTLTSPRRFILLTEYPALTGLKNLVKKWRLQSNHKINLIIMRNKLINEKCLDDVPFSDLAINILDHGVMGGEYYLPVIEKTLKSQKQALELTIRTDNINSLCWMERILLKHTGIPVKVHYAGLNDIYVKKVLGVAASHINKKVIEYDFSGLTDSNVRVMGIVQEQSIGSRVIAKPDLLWPVPDYWTLEDAATVPLAYCQALYYLCLKHRLYYGNSILVHGGAGALGQAIISIALAYGCNVYTTVSTDKKKRLLLRLFPQLKEVQIGNSRDGTFVDMILLNTKGKGCNIVISCVKEGLRNASTKCCSVFGFVIDTSFAPDNENLPVHDMQPTSALELYEFDRCVSFGAQQFSSIFESQNIEEMKKLQLMMSEGIARGYVRPLSRVVYASDYAIRALSLQAASNHRGRVLLNLNDDIFYTQSKINCSPDHLQIILTDDVVLGIQLADRLISRGAKKMELQCKSCKLNSLLFKLRIWETQGVEYKISYGKTWNEIDNNLLNSESSDDIEGVYCIVAKSLENENFPKCLKNLAFRAPTSNCQKRYFAVIDARKDGDEMVELMQTQEHIQVIRLMSLYKIENEHRRTYFSTNDSVDAIEKALCSKQRIVVAHGRNKTYDNLMQKLAVLTDITVPRVMSENVTLKDLGMDITKSEVVQHFLYNEYSISLDKSTILLLTTKKIQALHDKLLGMNRTETEGLKTFFTQINPDELSASAEMMFLPTLASRAMSDDEFDVSKSFLCIIPGVEGQHERFRVLCEMLKLPALVLQPGYERPYETIQELAHRYAKILQKNLPVNRPYYLLGYESGVLVALEMATILEKNGLTGTIFCIGGGPKDVQEIFEEHLAKFKTEESLQTAVARHMFTLFDKKHVNLEYLEDELKNNTWKQKVSICVRKLMGNMDNTIQYAKQVIEAAYARIVQVRRYKIQPRAIRSCLVFLRPASKNYKYPLSMLNYSQQQAFDYELGACLAFASQDLRCAAIINRHLDNDLLEEFENKSLCDTYNVNNDSIMFIK